MREWGAMETRAGIYGVFQRLPGFLLTVPCHQRPCLVAARPASRPPVPHLAREIRALPVRLVPTGPIRIFNFGLPGPYVGWGVRRRDETTMKRLFAPRNVRGARRARHCANVTLTCNAHSVFSHSQPVKPRRAAGADYLPIRVENVRHRSPPFARVRLRSTSYKPSFLYLSGGF